MWRVCGGIFLRTTGSVVRLRDGNGLVGKDKNRTMGRRDAARAEAAKRQLKGQLRREARIRSNDLARSDKTIGPNRPRGG